MADEDAFPQEPVGADVVVAGLAVHLLDGFRRAVEVVRGMAVAGRRGAVAVFQVGQPDLNFIPEETDGVDALVAAAVVHHRHGEGLAEALVDGAGEVGGRDEVDIVRPLSDELEIDLPQALDGDLRAFPQLGDLVILAVHAGQVAPGEEDRPRAAGAGDARLFPVVQRGSGDDGARAEAAVSHGPFVVEGFPPVDAAAAGAEIAEAHECSFQENKDGPSERRREGMARSVMISSGRSGPVRRGDAGSVWRGAPRMA